MNVERLLNYIGLSKKDPTNRLTKKADTVKFIKNEMSNILLNIYYVILKQRV